MKLNCYAWLGKVESNVCLYNRGKEVLFSGNSDLWNSLNYSDVVTFVTSMAEIAWIKKHRPLVHDGLIMTCGIGVGEISALVAAGALGMPQALKLVSKYQS